MKVNKLLVISLFLIVVLIFFNVSPDYFKNIISDVGSYIGPSQIELESEKDLYIPIEDSNGEEKTLPERIEEVFESESISDKTKGVEQAIFLYTNIERSNHGVGNLGWDEQLAIVARDHSLDMAENDYFSHTGLDGSKPTDRAIRHGYDVHKELGNGWYSDGIAENIAKMPTGNVIGVGYVSSDADSIGKAHVDSWMESPGHRENILKGDYDVIGVGVAYDGLNYVATQNFK